MRKTFKGSGWIVRHIPTGKFAILSNGRLAQNAVYFGRNIDEATIFDERELPELPAKEGVFRHCEALRAEFFRTVTIMIED